MGELQIKDAALAVPPCQGGCREFESRLPLHFFEANSPLPHDDGKLWIHGCPTICPTLAGKSAKPHQSNMRSTNSLMALAISGL